MDTEELRKRVEAIPYWYHRIELPDGIVTNGWSPLCADRYAIPDNLTGKRVLDIGAWDGYWTWEALKRGAIEVVAIDDFSDDTGDPKVKRNDWETFDLCREAFGFTKKVTDSVFCGEWWANEKGQLVSRDEQSIYEECWEAGTFDIVFFFGTIYHLKEPLKALEKISSICTGEIYIETASLDEYSPYKGGLGKGYDKNDMVMEFYPGKQYANNEGNWWVPTLQCLGAMVQSTGFDNIEAWPLTETPQELSECRGFVYGSKKGLVNEKIKEFEKEEPKDISVAAVMSVPRLGFQDNSFCVFEGVASLNIPLKKTTGAFWGQCLERGIQDQIDTHNPDAILTIDYDTVFTPEDVQTLIKLMRDNPQADVIVPMQMGRGDMQALMTVKSRTGQVRDNMAREEFAPDLVKIATGHFGLTLIRTESLLKIPHPWFKGEPNKEGQWGGGRIDDDIWFWKQFEIHNMNVYLANRITIGHMELVVKWPNGNIETLYQPVNEYQAKGKPEKVWK